MPAVTIALNKAALRSIEIARAQTELKVRANRVLNAARRGAPVDQGQLRASLHIEYTFGPNGEPIARIGSNLKYAIFVHEGTGIYGPTGQPIRPKHGRFLVWPVKNNSGIGRRRYKGGRTVQYAFARQVRGVRGRPFLVNALDAAKG